MRVGTSTSGVDDAVFHQFKCELESQPIKNLTHFKERVNGELSNRHYTYIGRRLHGFGMTGARVYGFDALSYRKLHGTWPPFTWAGYSTHQYNMGE